MNVIHPIPWQEAQGLGYNAIATILPADLTETATATAQTLTIPLTNKAAKLVGINIKTKLADASDNAFDDVTMKIGDGDDDDRFLASTQVGTSATVAKFSAIQAERTYASDTLDIILTPKTGKALAHIDVGDIELHLQIRDV